MNKVALNDAVLIERAQRGDSEAFDALVERHQARAYQYAFRLTGNKDEASDVVAEAFVRIFKALNNFKGDSAFTTWLHRIETNCFLDMRKKQRTRQAISLDAAVRTEDGNTALDIEDSAPSAHEESERVERMSAIQAAVKRLPEYQKAMIVMYHAQNLSYEEIADTLSLPIGTVKSRLNRARLGLRELLRPHRDLFAEAV